MTETNFSAVYYPFSRCFDLKALKRAIFYYDRIYFLDPYNLSQREKLITTSHYYDGIDFGHRHEWAEAIEKIYRPLEDEGWIEGVDIYPLIKKYDRELTENTIDDITDPIYCSYSFGDIDVNVEKVSWHVIEERTPPTLITNLQEVEWKEFRKEVAKNAAIYAPFNDPYYGKYLSFKEEYYEALESPSLAKRFANIYIPVEKCPQDSSRHGFGESSDPNGVSGYVFPYAIGASISINQALLFAALNGLSVFTDSLTQHFLLKRKCQNAIEVYHNPEKLKQNTKVLQSIKETDIVFSLFDDLIPDSYLNEMPIEQIIKFRKKHESELNNLRSYMLEIRNSLSNPWDEGYLEQILKICDQAKRETKSLRREFRQVTRNLKRDTIKATAGTILGLAAMPVSISLGAVIAAFVSKTPLDDIWTAWRRKSDLSEHDLTYLLLLEDTFHRFLKGAEQLPWEKIPVIRK